MSFKNGQIIKTLDSKGTVIKLFKDIGSTFVVVRYWVRHKRYYRYDVSEESILEFKIKTKKELDKFNRKLKMAWKE